MSLVARESLLQGVRGPLKKIFKIFIYNLIKNEFRGELLGLVGSLERERQPLRETEDFKIVGHL